MEENTNMTEQVTQAENMGNEADVQEETVKTFTQDDVNRIVQERLGRLKEQAAKESQVEYGQKLVELETREMKVMVKEKLLDRNMPRDLADLISCTDEEDLENKLNKLESIYGKKEEKPTRFQIKGSKPAEGNAGLPKVPDLYRNAMGLR